MGFVKLLELQPVGSKCASCFFLGTETMCD